MDRKLSVLLCGALTLALAGCQAPVEEPLLDPTVTVETTAVRAGDLSTQSTYIGTISAEGTASVVSMISGTRMSSTRQKNIILKSRKPKLPRLRI